MNGIVLSEGVKNQIQRYSEDTLTSIAQLDHVGELLYSDAYKNASNQLAAYLSGTVMRKKEAAYHQSLKWYEKCGFLSSGKQEVYQRSVDRAGKTTALVVNLATTAVPYIASAIESGVNKMNFEKFFMTWMGYINQGMEVSQIMLANTQSILKAANLNLSHERIRAGIRAGQAASWRQYISKRNRSSLNSAGEENMQSIAKLMVSTADLTNHQVRDRALEFMEDIFNISYYDAEQKIEDIQYAQDYLSSFVSFSSFDYISFFKEFVASSSETIKIGSYDVDMDVYAQKRANNKKNIIEVAKDVAEIGVKAGMAAATQNPTSLLGCVKPAASIIKLSEGLMSSTLNPECDPSKGREIMKTIIAQRKAYDMKREDA